MYDVTWKATGCPSEGLHSGSFPLTPPSLFPRNVLQRDARYRFHKTKIFDTFKSSASLSNKGAEHQDYLSHDILITVSELHPLCCSAPLLKCQKSVENLGLGETVARVAL